MDVYFLSPDKTKLYAVEEGSGDNLEYEDVENGYVDYWNSYLYDVKENTELDGGMWLEETLIDETYDCSAEGICKLINRLKECDAPEDLEKWTIIDPDKGKEMMWAVEDAIMERIRG